VALKVQPKLKSSTALSYWGDWKPQAAKDGSHGPAVFAIRHPKGQGEPRARVEYIEPAKFGMFLDMNTLAVFWEPPFRPGST
jgi:hypothetical protein